MKIKVIQTFATDNYKKRVGSRINLTLTRVGFMKYRLVVHGESLEKNYVEIFRLKSRAKFASYDVTYHLAQG